MTPHQAYRRNVQSGWTRVEMLLAIYDAAISALDEGIDALNQGRTEKYPALRLRVSQLFLLLISGVDAESSEVAASIRDLCIFCMDQTATPEVANWAAARNVMATLREGFLGIREQGIQLEAEGTIPHLSQGPAQTLLHV